MFLINNNGNRVYYYTSIIYIIILVYLLILCCRKTNNVSFKSTFQRTRNSTWKINCIIFSHFSCQLTHIRQYTWNTATKIEGSPDFFLPICTRQTALRPTWKTGADNNETSFEIKRASSIQFCITFGRSTRRPLSFFTSFLPFFLLTLFLFFFSFAVSWISKKVELWLFVNEKYRYAMIVGKKSLANGPDVKLIKHRWKAKADDRFQRLKNVYRYAECWIIDNKNRQTVLLPRSTIRQLYAVFRKYLNIYHTSLLLYMFAVLHEVFRNFNIAVTR